MKTALRIGIVCIALAAVVAYGGYKKMTGELFSPIKAAVEIEGAVPDFTLKDADGKEHSLSQYTKDGKIVVLEFCSQECPYSRGVDPSLIALNKEYADKGVVFLGIDSNKSTTPENIKEFQLQSGKSYPVLKDVDNKYADVIGAKVTPEVLLVDKEGKARYHGAPDNRMSPEGAPSEFFLKDALESLLAAKPVETTKTKAWGCGIKRK